MNSATSLPGSQTPEDAMRTGGTKWWESRTRQIVTTTLWGIGLLLLAGAAFIMHNHPGPWPGEPEFSRAVQHVSYWPWIPPFLKFLGAFNDPLPAAIELGVWLVVMTLLRWFWQALFLGLSVGIGNGIDALIADYVVRPRPRPNLIHVDTLLTYNSFPSGHSCHMFVYYGFLLFLSFTEPVRKWRYQGRYKTLPLHLLLLPLQIFAVLNILLTGFSRLYEGEHWITDILGGTLSGILWLSLFIFLYRLTMSKLEERRAKKPVEQPMQVYEG